MARRMTLLCLVVAVVVSALVQVCGAQQTAVQIGLNVPPLVSQRILTYIETSSQFPVQVFDPEQEISPPVGSLLLSFGDTVSTRKVISSSELEQLGDEGFIVRSVSSNYTTIVTNGNQHHNQRYRFGQHIGAAYGTYALLEEIGFGFLQPLEPLIPRELTIPQSTINKVEKPRWARRGWHYHTMHPLELTDFLQGLDVGTPADPHYESWDSMIPDWESFVEWSVANYQNEIEFVLLIAKTWEEFGWSEDRKARYRIINQICHDFGTASGADAPIALVQQHSWSMIDRPYADPERAFQEIRKRVDWWMDAGFDFISTENGFSEFQSGNCTQMLSYMNELTRYAADVYGKETFIKVHISTGQYCEEFEDPETGGPLNFNFLPIYADERLGIMPHTVQLYALDDPAPTYGNQNFTFMFDFMMSQAGKGRDVLYYPETSYWVNYDIQVPLFLPVYCYNRLRDLRMIAKREGELGVKIDGQFIFDSGWEWGYWMQNVISARAVWNPFMDIETDEDALRASLYPITKHFGASQNEITELIVKLSLTQQDLLVFGKVDGQVPEDIVKRNGIAYIEGWDSFAEIGTSFESFLNTQPSRLGLLEFRTSLNPKPNYKNEVEPLLNAMSVAFTQSYKDFLVYNSSIPEYSSLLFEEIIDSTSVLAQRATQIHALYDYASTHREGETEWRKERLAVAEACIAEAEVSIRRRESHYRTPLLRIAGWREGPTAYINMYLWNVKSLYYFWRDYDKAVFADRSLLSPCYVNFINPADIAFGEGNLYNLSVRVREWADQNDPGNHFVLDCIAAPSQEITFPRNNTLVSSQ